MSSDLIKIKDKYGENMMRMCRKLFSTILEEEGKLFEILSSHFDYSKFLYYDIINNSLEDNFKNYIYKLYENDFGIDMSVDMKPHDLLDKAGYILYECKIEDDIQSFRKYFEPKEALCTFRGNRLNKCFVFFAIKKNVSEIKREDFIHPYRQDLYGTSVISIQFSKGNINTLSIKNRYNHTVDNPDATFSNNLENIIPGLTYSFEKYYNFNIGNKCEVDFELPGYVRSRDINNGDEVIPGKYYKYNYEINNIYYCDNNIIIDNFEVIDKYNEKEKYILMDYFILDLVNKEIKLYDDNIEDSFISVMRDIKKINIIKNKNNKNRKLEIITDDNNVINIELDIHNRIICYENKFINFIPNNFLKENIYLENMDVCNALKIGDNVLYNNYNLVEMNLLKVIDVGDNFLYKNNIIKKIELPNVVRIGDNFLYKNKVVDFIDLFSLNQVGDSFLYENRGLLNAYFPYLVYVGDNFITCNRNINSILLSNLVNVGDNFLCGNKSLEKMELPNLKQIGDNFLRCNEKLREFDAFNLEIVGSSFMYSNRCLQVLELSKLRLVDNNFLYKNNSITCLYLNELYRVGPCFMRENNSLLVFSAEKLNTVGINFLPNNSVLEYVILSSLQEYNRSFLEKNNSIKKKVLGLN